MQKHQLFNPRALESRDRLLSLFVCFFFNKIQNWNVGGLARWPLRICIHMQIHSWSVTQIIYSTCTMITRLTRRCQCDLFICFGGGGCCSRGQRRLCRWVQRMQITGVNPQRRRDNFSGKKSQEVRVSGWQISARWHEVDLKPTRLYLRTGSLQTSDSKRSSVIRIQPPANTATNQEARTENRHQHFVGGDDHELICTLSFYSYATHISRYCFLCLHCFSFLVCTACNLHFFYLAQPSGGERYSGCQSERV